MTFEEGLRVELKQITELDNKVYPIVAPEVVKPPFLVFKKQNLKFVKTLSGHSTKAEGVYILTLIVNDYEELQILQENIKNKIISLLFKNVGDSGPYIQDIDITFNGDNYVVNPSAIKSDIMINVNY